MDLETILLIAILIFVIGIAHYVDKIKKKLIKLNQYWITTDTNYFFNFNLGLRLPNAYNRYQRYCSFNTS